MYKKLLYFVIQIIRLIINLAKCVVFEIQNTKYFQSFVIVFETQIQNTFICSHKIQNIKYFYVFLYIKYKIFILH